LSLPQTAYPHAYPPCPLSGGHSLSHCRLFFLSRLAAKKLRPSVTSPAVSPHADLLSCTGPGFTPSGPSPPWDPYICKFPPGARVFHSFRCGSVSRKFRFLPSRLARYCITVGSPATLIWAAAVGLPSAPLFFPGLFSFQALIGCSASLPGVLFFLGAPPPAFSLFFCLEEIWRPFQTESRRGRRRTAAPSSRPKAQGRWSQFCDVGQPFFWILPSRLPSLAVLHGGPVKHFSWFPVEVNFSPLGSFFWPSNFQLPLFAFFPSDQPFALTFLSVPVASFAGTFIFFFVFFLLEVSFFFSLPFSRYPFCVRSLFQVPPLWRVLS